VAVAACWREVAAGTRDGGLDILGAASILRSSVNCTLMEVTPWVFVEFIDWMPAMGGELAL